ncbi:uncharacterized protein PV09_00028 [Verruconis gallopava]|uniref:Myb-like domain-containing protein n=1 Tax=Verruconis gallopava TaxID=253628 RepID=A0A0D1Z815_9PEZI|nr:uncharacterized protein PV09_00028 [Verruconis gallopava]KIW09082.1 hypothetical protein PV09_00028 [Verruconis gallopava]
MAPTQPVTPQHTPIRKANREGSSMSTPRQDVPSSSPLISGTWTSEGHPPSPRPHYYTPIAPNPAGLPARKHALDRNEPEGPNAKRVRQSPQSPSPLPEMTSEDKLLLKLRDQDGLSWKEIVTKFAEDLNKDYQPAALQMRIKRLRDRMRVWTDGDVQALRLAHQYWMETKFDIIASKMVDFGSTEKWSAKQCRQKWAEMCSSSDHVSGPTYSSTMFGGPPNYQPRV